MKRKLAVITSHPIQYQAPLFKRLAAKEDIDLTVYFCWDFGVQNPDFDKEFGVKLKWDMPLLDGYAYKFLKNYSLKRSTRFWGQINPGIVGEIGKSKFDAVMVFGWNSFTNWLAFFTAFLTGTKVFLRGENPLNQELIKPKWKLSLKKIILKPLFGRISAFLCIGRENYGFYEYYGVPKNKLFFVPYAVENERFMAAAAALKPKRKEFRKKLLDIGDDRPVALFVGKLIDKKRPMDLLQAFDIAAGSISFSAALVFVGDGILRPELEKYSEEHNLKNVHFAGFRNQTELPKYYAIADVFVLPSGPGETWGLVVNEAMCFGLPVVVSNMVGCVSDLVKEGENGFTTPLGDVAALAEKLLFLASDKNVREKFGIVSRRIIARYSHEEDVKGIIAGFSAATKRSQI